MAGVRKVIGTDGTNYTFPSDLSVEEIRTALSSSAGANVDSATVETLPDGTIKFVAPTGGRKG